MQIWNIDDKQNIQLIVSETVILSWLIIRVSKI